MASSTSMLPGQKYHDCTVVNRISGESIMEDHLYLATKSEEFVTIKVFNNGRKSPARMEREVKLQEAAAILGIAPRVIYASSTERVIIAEQLCGESLLAILRDGRVLSIDVQKKIVDVWELLAIHHITHGNMSLQNIIINEATGTVHVIDFSKATRTPTRRSTLRSIETLAIMLSSKNTKVWQSLPYIAELIVASPYIHSDIKGGFIRTKPYADVVHKRTRRPPIFTPPEKLLTSVSTRSSASIPTVIEHPRGVDSVVVDNTVVPNLVKRTTRSMVKKAQVAMT